MLSNPNTRNAIGRDANSAGKYRVTKRGSRLKTPTSAATEAGRGWTSASPGIQDARPRSQPSFTCLQPRPGSGQASSLRTCPMSKAERPSTPHAASDLEFKEEREERHCCFLLGTGQHSVRVVGSAGSGSADLSGVAEVYFRFLQHTVRRNMVLFAHGWAESHQVVMHACCECLD